jgi:hypothetical protein
MNIVNVTIVSGCLLAANNQSTSAGIAGAEHEALEHHPKHVGHSTKFQTSFEDPDSQKVPPHKWGRKEYLHYLLGLSDAYETEFQPVSLWSRGANKMKWIKKSEAWRADPEFRKFMQITWSGWFLKVFIPTFSLIALPPGAYSSSQSTGSSSGCIASHLPLLLTHPSSKRLVRFCRNSKLLTH